MRVAVGIAVVVAGLAIGAWIWRARSGESRPTPFGPQPPELIEPPTGGPRLEQPALAPTVESSPPSETRVAAAPADPAPPSANEDLALVRVHLLWKDDRSPITSKRVALLRYDDHQTIDCSPVSGQHGRLGECPTTGDDGWAELEAESDIGCSIWLAWQEPALANHDVAPLARGERRDIEILITRQTEVLLLGVLLDAEVGAPIAGGTVGTGDATRMISSTLLDSRASTRLGAAREPTGSAIRTGADGRFQLRDGSGRRIPVTASAPGYARTVFTFVPGHSDPNHPLEVRLSRYATVQVSVADELGRPIADATVELSSARQIQPSYPWSGSNLDAGPRWSAQTDANGNSSVAGLPPSVPLKLSVRRSGSKPREEAEPLVLNPGEYRTLEVVCGPGALVRGQVIDGEGRPIANQELWRMVSRWDNGLPLLFEAYATPAARTRTDENGRFQFLDVPPGVWCIGISPESQVVRADNSAGGFEILDFSSGLPAYAESVDVKADGEVVEFILRVDADQGLSGTVVDPLSLPVSNCRVVAWLENTNIAASGETDTSGHFDLGPLPNGTWTLVAGGMESESAQSLPVVAQAGKEDILLQLRAGGSIVGTVVSGETLDPTECDLCLATTNAEPQGWTMSGSRNGEFRFKGLQAGTYVISAHDRSGAIGISQPIRLDAGQAVRDVEIKLARGAQLRLRYEGKAISAGCSIFSNGRPIRSIALDRGKTNAEPVPAGEVEMRWFDRKAGTAETLSLTLAVGETREVSWDGNP